MNDKAIEHGLDIFDCADELRQAAEGLIAKGYAADAVVSSLNGLYSREMARITGGPDPLSNQTGSNPAQSAHDDGTACTAEFERVMTDLAGRGFRGEAVAHALMVTLLNLDNGAPAALLQVLGPGIKPAPN